MAERSDQVAHLLSANGVTRGTSVVVMLGNQVELWEPMLAVIKLGAVVMPTTTAVNTSDLIDRMTRGGTGAVVCTAEDAQKLDGVPGEYARIAVGEASNGRTPHSLAFEVEAAVVPAPDPVRLAIPKAYVVLVDGYEPTAETARSIFAHCRQQLPPYLRVRRLEFSDLPKTISGKTRRVDLWARESEIAGRRVEGEHRDGDFPDLVT